MVTRFKVSVLKLVLKHKRDLDPTLICDVMTALIAQVKVVHSKGFIYKNLHPTAIGFMNPDAQSIMLCDFEFSQSYIDSMGQHIPDTITNMFVGSPGYASLRTHKGLSTSRKDDLESSFYLLWFMIYGNYP